MENEEELAQLERINNLENELIEQHREFLAETGFGIQLVPMPIPDFSQPSGIMNQVILQDITDINAWSRPFFQPLPNVKPKLAFYLSNPDQAVVQNWLKYPTGMPANYYQNPFADSTLKKLVSVGHFSNSANSDYSNYTRTKFFFRTAEITTDSRVSMVINYLLNFKGEWTNSPANSGNGYLIQNVVLSFNINAIPSNVINPSSIQVHSETIKLYAFDSRITPLQQENLSFAQNLGIKLQSIDFDASKDHYYELELALYTYSSTIRADAALQAELQIIDFV